MFSRTKSLLGVDELLSGAIVSLRATPAKLLGVAIESMNAFIQGIGRLVIGYLVVGMRVVSCDVPLVGIVVGVALCSLI